MGLNTNFLRMRILPEAQIKKPQTKADEGAEEKDNSPNSQVVPDVASGAETPNMNSTQYVNWLSEMANRNIHITYTKVGTVSASTDETEETQDNDVSTGTNSLQINSDDTLQEKLQKARLQKAIEEGTIDSTEITASDLEVSSTDKLQKAKLQKAILSGSFEDMTKILDELGVTYEKEKTRTEGVYVLKFRYDLEDYEISCKSNEEVESAEEPEVESSLPKELQKSIDSGYLEDITKALDELGIAYEQTKTGVEKDETGYIETSLYTVKFNYQGKDYEISCRSAYSYDKTPIDNSVETKLENIKDAITDGDKSVLKQLTDLGIEYVIQKNSFDGFTVTFSYNGVEHKAIYIAPNQQTGTDNVDSSEQPETDSLPKSLQKAISSGFVEDITNTLEELGIAYEEVKAGIEKDKTGYVETSLYVVKFNYEGKDYEISCKSAYSSDKTPIDNSPKTRLKQAIELFRSGSTSQLSLLKSLGIEYNMQENADGGYIVSFEYDGKSYVAAHDFVSEELTEAINSANQYLITAVLDKIDIDYAIVEDEYKIFVKFIYDGHSYEIPCDKYAEEEGMIDNSAEAKLEYAIGLFRKGSTTQLTILKDLGIEYNMQKNADGGYTITFSYEGVDYKVTYIPDDTPGTSQETEDMTQEDISDSFSRFSS